MASSSASPGKTMFGADMETVVREGVENGILALPGRALRRLPSLEAFTAAQLFFVTELDISNNRFQQLPPEVVAGLAELETLDCSHNAIASLPDMTALQSLTTVNLRRNNLAAFPTQLCLLPLTTLDLSSNKLTAIPAEIQRLSNLTILDLGNNRLAELPVEFTRLLKLQEVHLARNELHRLPENIGSMSELCVLDVRQNALASLPVSLVDLHSLVSLQVDSNPLLTPPAQICAKGRVHILSFLSGEKERLLATRTTAAPDAASAAPDAENDLSQLSQAARDSMHDNGSANKRRTALFGANEDVLDEIFAAGLFGSPADEPSSPFLSPDTARTNRVGDRIGDRIAASGVTMDESSTTVSVATATATAATTATTGLTRDASGDRPAPDGRPDPDPNPDPDSDLRASYAEVRQRLGDANAELDVALVADGSSTRPGPDVAKTDGAAAKPAQPLWRQYSTPVRTVTGAEGSLQELVDDARDRLSHTERELQAVRGRRSACDAASTQAAKANTAAPGPPPPPPQAVSAAAPVMPAADSSPLTAVPLPTARRPTAATDASTNTTRTSSQPAKLGRRLEFHTNGDTSGHHATHRTTYATQATRRPPEADLRHDAFASAHHRPAAVVFAPEPLPSFFRAATPDAANPSRAPCHKRSPSRRRHPPPGLEFLSAMDERLAKAQDKLLRLRNSRAEPRRQDGLTHRRRVAGLGRLSPPPPGHSSRAHQRLLRMERNVLATHAEAARERNEVAKVLRFKLDSLSQHHLDWAADAAAPRPPPPRYGAAHLFAGPIYDASRRPWSVHAPPIAPVDPLPARSNSRVFAGDPSPVTRQPPGRPFPAHRAASASGSQGVGDVVRVGEPQAPPHALPPRLVSVEASEDSEASSLTSPQLPAEPRWPTPAPAAPEPQPQPPAVAPVTAASEPRRGPSPAEQQPHPPHPPHPPPQASEAERHTAHCLEVMCAGAGMICWLESPVTGSKQAMAQAVCRLDPRHNALEIAFEDGTVRTIEVEEMTDVRGDSTTGPDGRPAASIIPELFAVAFWQEAGCHDFVGVTCACCVAKTAAEADLWRTGLKHLIAGNAWRSGKPAGHAARVSRLHSRCLAAATASPDGRLELARLAECLGVPEATVRARLLARFSTTGQHTHLDAGLAPATRISAADLDAEAFAELLDAVVERPDLDAVFDGLPGRDPSGERLTLAGLSTFVSSIQRERTSDAGSSAAAIELVAACEPGDAAAGGLSRAGFRRLMQSDLGALVCPRSHTVEQDMQQPLPHYFVASSHNTYVTDQQFTGLSSAEVYRQVLLAGCRCVELDCWDGAAGSPVIMHGFAGSPLTTPIPFAEVVVAIRDYGFRTSPFPVILSLENHCSLAQQDIMAADLAAILGESLQRPDGPECPATRGGPGDAHTPLPSPERLRNRVLIKAKVPRAAAGAAGAQAAESAHGISERLAALVHYLVPRKVVFPAPPGDPFAANEMVSMSEKKAKKLMAGRRSELVAFGVDHLARVYPSGSRIWSSNFNPQLFWNLGCQLVSLNYHRVGGVEQRLNLAKFRSNGGSGYVLKPEAMRAPGCPLDPLDPAPALDACGAIAQHVEVAVLSTTFVAERRPRLRVCLYGLPCDSSAHKSAARGVLHLPPRAPRSGKGSWKRHQRRDERGQPQQAEAEPSVFELQDILCPELAILYIGVGEKEALYACVPLTDCRAGFRTIFLEGTGAHPLASLLLRVTIRDGTSPLPSSPAAPDRTPTPRLSAQSIGDGLLSDDGDPENRRREQEAALKLHRLRKQRGAGLHHPRPRHPGDGRDERNGGGDDHGQEAARCYLSNSSSSSEEEEEDEGEEGERSDARELGGEGGGEAQGRAYRPFALCPQCREPLFAQQGGGQPARFVVAGGLRHHEACFCCYHCGAGFAKAGALPYPHLGRLYCLPCRRSLLV